jgi:hypothetical protein|nr:MAG TPA: hypothetical protein [Caudoviricetes sp.]
MSEKLNPFIPVLKFRIGREITIEELRQIQETGAEVESDYSRIIDCKMTKQVFDIYPGEQTNLVLLVTVLQNIASVK